MDTSASKVWSGKDGLRFSTTNNGAQSTLEAEIKPSQSGTTPKNPKRY